MFRLRFLVANDRRIGSVIFTHRNHRGKRTTLDPMHPEYWTYPVETYAEFLELWQGIIRDQPTARVMPLLEWHNPETGERRRFGDPEMQRLLLKDGAEIPPLPAARPAASLAPIERKPALPSAKEIIEEFNDGAGILSVVLPAADFDSEINTQDQWLAATLQALNAEYSGRYIYTGQIHTQADGRRLADFHRDEAPKAQPPEPQRETPVTYPEPPTQPDPIPTTTNLANRIFEATFMAKKPITHLADELGVTKEAIADAVTNDARLTYKSGWVGRQ